MVSIIIVVSLDVLYTKAIFGNILFTPRSESINSAISPSTLVVYVIAILIALLVEALMEGWVTAMMKEIKERGEASSKQSFSILTATIGSVIAGVILMVLIVVAGFICLVIPGVVFGVALSCIVPAIVMHNFGAVEGLKASWRFCWQGKNFWRLFALIIILCLVSAIPFIGGHMVAFIGPLWFPYAYTEYV